MRDISDLEDKLQLYMDKYLELEEKLLSEDSNSKQIDSLNAEREKYKQMTLDLEKQLSNGGYTRESFKGNDKKTKFYTGISSYDTLEVLFEALEIYLPESKSCSKFKLFVLTLMKLRLATTFTDLGYRFNISLDTASKYFHIYLFTMYIKLKPTIIWPDREELIETMPVNFKKKYGNKVAVIIDCFEVFSEKPSHLEGSSQLYSYYKHHHTLKVLIGITPQGTISFISSAYNGRASDKFVTNHSRILNNLNTGDIVLADRGFLITDEIQLRKATLIMPAFTKGKTQLHPLDVEETREIANLRIHVERVIGSVRQKYTILFTKIPISILSKQLDYTDIPVIDQIITVSAALVNFCPSVVISPT